MFSSSPNYTKLKTNLRLCVGRLKLLEKKKAELTQKSRKEIADYIAAGKVERAKIRVECIIREDYLIEAMELTEMYCDLLLARFGLVTQMKNLDEGISEAVSSLIWVSPRLQTDCQELKVVADLLTAKYGLPFAEACRVESVETINQKLKHKLSIHSPPKILVEKYMVEIAKSFNIPYEPDPQVMQEEQAKDSLLIDFGDKNNLGMPQPPGFVGFPQPPALPTMPFNNYSGGKEDNLGGPTAPSNSFPYGAPFSYNIPPNAETKDSNTHAEDDNPPTYSMISPDDNLQNKDQTPKPMPRSKINGGSYPDLPELPNVPSDSMSKSDDIDFDDLTRRFEELKKKK